MAAAVPAPILPSNSVDSVNPATGEIIGRFQKTRLEDLPAVLARAREVQRHWSLRPLQERSTTLLRLRDVVYARRDEVLDVVCRETGKPRVEAIFTELIFVLDMAGFIARWAPRWLRPERVPHHNIAVKAKSARISFEPWGAVAVISPWNFPFSIPMTALIPAVAAGNAVILKPSELTPWTGDFVGELFREAGFPAGLVQVVQGAGDAGAALIEAGPDKVFFTGSVATGRKIAEACGRKLIPSVLELGGKDAMIVLADADLDVASSAAVWGGFMNCGQACLSVERIYVEQPAVASFTQLCVEKTRKLRLGPPGDSDAEIGPMIHTRQVEKVEAQLADAAARGARLLVGGKRRRDLGPNFFEPTVVAGVNGSMLLMQEETFGPVIAIQTVESAEEAVSRANDTIYGLAASVWTKDARRGAEIAAQLHCGSVMVNDVASYYGICEAPHGGCGASGWGRSHGRHGLLEMVQVKYMDVDRLPRAPKSWWYGYSAELGGAAERFVQFLYAPVWRTRLAALGGRRGAWKTLFRGHRV